VNALRTLLGKNGLRIESAPIVFKYLSNTQVRLMFPVTGCAISRAAVVSVVCLFDRDADQTLYAHPMHAGPEVNPLVKHLDSPMSAPKSQDGRNGDRANRRIIEHKKALWVRFREETRTLGEQQAGRRWRDGYYWALKRLYFCCGCSQCKWGSPFFDGPLPASPRKPTTWTAVPGACELGGQQRAIVAHIVASAVWQLESRYAQRGGYTLSKQPALIKSLGSGFVQVMFPTTVSLIEAGALVAAAFTYDVEACEVMFSYCLCAGPEADIQLLHGDRALGLPQARPPRELAEARARYKSWRGYAWAHFWMDELDNGIAVASRRWLVGFWQALEDLFSGNEIAPVDIDTLTANNPRIAELANTRLPDPQLPVQALENMGGRCFSGFVTNSQGTPLRATGLDTLMVNLGFRCNMACQHCHVDAGPNRHEEMTRETVDLVLDVLRKHGIKTLDITGGAPEMNPHFRYLAESARKIGCRVVDRCNLTVFFEPGYEDLPEFLACQGIEVMASLPSLKGYIADQQRGVGSFQKSIRALQQLNALGYAAQGSGLVLNLVCNPSGVELGARQDQLEDQYKHDLRKCHNIRFNRLLAMNNMPIKRFAHFLRREGQFDEYANRLVWAFNPDTSGATMCRHTLSVGYDGRLYDCDFNQMTKTPVGHGLPAHIREFDADALGSRIINTAGHCFGCTAGAGSSCNGALASNSRGLYRTVAPD